MQPVLAIIAVFAIIYVVPIVVYGAASALGGAELPTEVSPGRFLSGVAITKLGTAIAFVLLLALASSALTGRWPLYAIIWFVMFATSEIGDAVTGRSTTRDAALGIVSEAIYAPAAAVAAYGILGIG